MQEYHFTGGLVMKHTSQLKNQLSSSLGPTLCLRYKGHLYNPQISAAIVWVHFSQNNP